MGCHAVDQRRGEVDVKDRQEEDDVDCQSNQEEGEHPHFKCQHRAGSAEQLGVWRQRKEGRFDVFADGEKVKTRRG